MKTKENEEKVEKYLFVVEEGLLFELGDGEDKQMD